MIYKVVAVALLAAEAVNADRFRLTTSTAGSGGTNTGVDIHKIRGASYIVAAESGTPVVDVLMTSSTNQVPGVSTSFAALSAVSTSANRFGNDIAFGGDHVTGNMLFAQEGFSTLNRGQVVYYRGAYTTWYVFISTAHTLSLLMICVSYVCLP